MPYTIDSIRQLISKPKPKTAAELQGRLKELNARDELGFTPITFVAANLEGHQCLVLLETLVSLGAEIDAVDGFGKNALGYAAPKGNPTVIFFLKEVLHAQVAIPQPADTQSLRQTMMLLSSPPNIKPSASEESVINTENRPPNKKYPH